MIRVLLSATFLLAPLLTCGSALAQVMTGAEVLLEGDLGILAGRRVGLITNHTARVGERHLADVLHSRGDVTLAALFAPEHGIRGTADAGAAVPATVDSATGLTVHSLHGDTYRPSPEMLSGIDVLVFDMQDVGTRFYTYISTMGYAMQAAAEAGIPFVVLDRPNPLGGLLIEGFILEPEHHSFIGLYEMPVTHGMTVGEVARMIKGEAMLPGLEGIDLHVVEMRGWRRAMLWPETGLPWIPPSPNLPTFEAAVVYPGACFFGSTTASEGRGTLEPFVLVGAPWADGAALTAELNSRDLPGLRFEPAAFTPRSIPGMSTNPKLRDTPVEGIRHVVIDPYAVAPVAAGVHTLSAFYWQAPEAERTTFFVTAPMLRVSGTDRLYRMIEQGVAPEDIIAAWAPDVEAFRERRRPYLLYD